MSEANKKPKEIRCAIYTRKSTTEGLEQEFNTLDAQRESCSSYIASQRHEGQNQAHGRGHWVSQKHYPRRKEKHQQGKNPK
jgi:DNA invertase Pin-like site-specific DNA recombinase